MINEHLMGVPDEIWDEILNQKRMDVQDIANFRSVNKKSNALAENLFKAWIIKLDDRHEDDEKRGPYLETLLDLRVEEVRVFHFLEQLSFRPQGVVFKFPDLIKRVVLEFENDEQCDMLISSENLHVLLKSRNLEHLTLGLVEENVNSSVYSSQPPLLGYDFSKLQALDLDIRHQDEPFNLVQGNLLDRILKSSIYENLCSVDFLVQIDANLVTAYQMSCDMLEFIVKYGHTLTSVNFMTIVPDKSPEGFPHTYESIDESILNNCSSLTSLIVYSDFLHEAWRQFIKIQTKLTEFELVDISIPLSLLRIVIDRNHHTLCSIKIHDLETETAVVDRHLDFSIFSSCQNLTLLSLHFKMNVVNRVGRNLIAINQNLEELEMHFLLSSVDLRMFCSSHIKLKKLTLTDAGTLGNFGINGSVLESLLALAELTDINIDKFSMNLSNPVETVKLKSIMDTFGIIFDRVNGENIYLNRDPSTNLWCKKLCSETSE